MMIHKRADIGPLFSARRQIEGLYAIAEALGHAISWKRGKYKRIADFNTFRLKLRQCKAR